MVLDQKEHRLVALNPAGGLLWHRLDAPRSVEELVSGDTTDEVRSFFEELAELGLLKRTTKVEPADAQWTSDDVPPAANDDAPGSSSPETVPSILWQEPIQNVAQTAGGCAFNPGQNAICNAVPFS